MNKMALLVAAIFSRRCSRVGKKPGLEDGLTHFQLPLIGMNVCNSQLSSEQSKSLVCIYEAFKSHEA